VVALLDDDAAQGMRRVQVGGEPLIRPLNHRMLFGTGARCQVLRRRVKAADNPAGNLDAAPGPRRAQAVEVAEPPGR